MPCPLPSHMTATNEVFIPSKSRDALLCNPVFSVFFAIVMTTLFGSVLGCAWEVVASVGSVVGREISAVADRLNWQDLLGVGAAGFLAQIVDGSLGMGYGVTSSTVLVLAGLSPATASASVHLAQLGTTAISGLAHHKYGNVDMRTMWKLSIPGSLGAFCGATILASIPSGAAKTTTAALLFAMGLRILVRGGKAHQQQSEDGPAWSVILPLGVMGGFVDATGGGGWGPVVTSGLLTDGSLVPKRAIGTVSASEFFVTVACVLGFFCALGGSHGATAGDAVRIELVLMLLAGGMIAAPVAPLFVAWLDARMLGIVVGGFVCFTTLRTLLKALSLSDTATYAAYLVLSAVVLVCVNNVACQGATHRASTLQSVQNGSAVAAKCAGKNGKDHQLTKKGARSVSPTKHATKARAKRARSSPARTPS